MGFAPLLLPDLILPSALSAMEAGVVPNHVAAAMKASTTAAIAATAATMTPTSAQPSSTNLPPPSPHGFSVPGRAVFGHKYVLNVIFGTGR
jgi:hypothetical protein